MRRTAIYFDTDQDKHTSFGHPESHHRLVSVFEHLKRAELLERLLRLTPTSVEDDVLEAVHRPAYLAMLQASVSDRTIWLDPDTYLTPASLGIARSATGGTLACVDAVFDGSSDNAMSLNRPPGHHATPSRAMGFCLLNHVAIAARYAQSRYGVERVAIVDFDVHHGNGTQDAFYEDGSVLFMSVHESPLYPGTGHRGERGEGAGQGHTINVPIPAGCSDRTYALVFEQIFEPAIARFRPDLILISAGYDSHWRDPLANQNVTISGFSEMVRSIQMWSDRSCSGRVVACLEGGYDLDMLPWSVGATLELLLDPDASPRDPFPLPDREEPDVSELIEDLASEIESAGGPE